MAAHSPYWKSLRLFGRAPFHSEWNGNETWLSTTGSVEVKEKKFIDNSPDFDGDSESHDLSGDVGGASGGTAAEPDHLLS